MGLLLTDLLLLLLLLLLSEDGDEEEEEPKVEWNLSLRRLVRLEKLDIEVVDSA